MIGELTTLFERDLDRLKQEIGAFKQDRNLWKTTGNISDVVANKGV